MGTPPGDDSSLPLAGASPPADHRVERPRVEGGQPSERSGAHGRGRFLVRAHGVAHVALAVVFSMLLLKRWVDPFGGSTHPSCKDPGQGGAGRERTRRCSTRTHPEPGRALRQRWQSTGVATPWEARPLRAAPPCRRVNPLSSPHTQYLSNEYCVLSPSRGGAAAARWAHNPKVVGSNPTPATMHYHKRALIRGSAFVCV